MRLFVISAILASLVLGGCRKPTESTLPNRIGVPVQNAPVRLTSSNEKEVTFYPAYSNLREDNWVFDLRGWVHQRRKFVNRFIAFVASLGNKCHGQRMDIFKARSDVFECNDESGEKVIIEFDSDPEGTRYPFKKRSGGNGIVELSLALPKTKVEKLLEAQKSPNKWLTYRAVSKGHIGLGRIKLIEQQGVSIVSDIDDTIKISEIPSGHERVFDYAFCREFEAAPSMADKYRDWGNAAAHPEWGDVPFHYVSGGPQQLLGPLYDFLIVGQGGFPEGTFHLRFLPKNILEKETKESLKRFVGGNMRSTFEHKVSEITKLMETFPGRKFILVGDSGEVDPEVYYEIRKARGQQVQEIWIRDVVDDSKDNPYRLTEMKIIQPDKTVCMDERHYNDLSKIVDETHAEHKYQKTTSKRCD